MKRTLLTLLLALSVFACSTRTVTKYKVVQPKPEHVEQRVIPAFTGKTCNALGGYALDLQAVILLSNADKRALKAWYETIQLELDKADE